MPHPSLFRNRSLLERHLTPPFAEAPSFLHLAAPGYIPFDAGAGLGQEDAEKVIQYEEFYPKRLVKGLVTTPGIVFCVMWLFRHSNLTFCGRTTLSSF